MYHSLTIKVFSSRSSGAWIYNTYDDFHLVPTSLPVISTPGIKTKSVEVPGADGAIDLTESLTPYPLYNNRTGSLEFALLTSALSSTSAWTRIYSEITNKIHGRICQIILEDDPDWFYEGRIAVNQWQSSNDGKWPIITLNYDLQPYKLSTTKSIDETLPTGYTLPSGFSATGIWKNITINNSSFQTYGIVKNGTIKMDNDLVGWMPVSPKFTINANSYNMGIKIINPELGYTHEQTFGSSTSTKSYSDPECILYDHLRNGFTMQLKGNGSMSIEFRKGSL